MLFYINKSTRKNKIMLLLFLVSAFIWFPANIKADGDTEITGTIQAKTSTSITVNSLLVTLTSSTRIYSDMYALLSKDSLKIGSAVRMEVHSLSNGTFEATSIKLMNTMQSQMYSGTITLISANSFTLAGKVFNVDSNTLYYSQFHATLKFTDLKAGYTVSVRAVQNMDGSYKAVTVMVFTNNTNAEIELEGKIQEITSNSIKVMDTVFFVDSTSVIIKEEKGFVALVQLKVGDYVEIRGFQKPDSTYLAKMIKVESDIHAAAMLEIEGRISSITANSLTVSGVVCYADSSTVVFADEGKLLFFSDLKIGDLVEVKALLQPNGTYSAARIKLENGDSQNDFEIHGTIETVSSNSFTIGGYTVNVNSDTKIYNQLKQPVLFSTLASGNYVFVKAIVKNGGYMATDIRLRQSNVSEVKVTGSISSISSSSFTVNGISFTVDSSTVFRDNDRYSINFSDLKIGQIVTVSGYVQNTNQYHAVRVKINDLWRSAVNVEGNIDLITPASITVSGKLFVVNSATVVIGNSVIPSLFASLTAGLKVEVRGVFDSNGTLVAKIIKVHSDNEYEVFGRVELKSANTLTVAGLVLTVDSKTLIYNEFGSQISYDSLQINQMVEVAYIKNFTSNVAVKIEIEKENNSVHMTGIVTSSTNTNLSLSVPSFQINNGTVFFNASFSQITYADINSGQTVDVWATQDAYGNLYAVQVQQSANSSVTSVENESVNTLPTGYELKQNYPNPFNPTTVISFSLPQQANVVLKIYDAIGQEVATLVNRQMSAGKYSVDFNGSNHPSGVYFYRLKAGNYVEVKKMLLIK